MTDGQEQSLGEIGRAVERIERALELHKNESRNRFHELANSMNTALGPMSAHAIQIDNQQRALARLDDEVKAVTKDANRIAGAGTILAILVGLIPWPWKH